MTAMDSSTALPETSAAAAAAHRRHYHYHHQQPQQQQGQYPYELTQQHAALGRHSNHSNNLHSPQHYHPNPHHHGRHKNLRRLALLGSLVMFVAWKASGALSLYERSSSLSSSNMSSSFFSYGYASPSESWQRSLNNDNVNGDDNNNKNDDNADKSAAASAAATAQWNALVPQVALTGNIPAAAAPATRVVESSSHDDDKENNNDDTKRHNVITSQTNNDNVEDRAIKDVNSALPATTETNSTNTKAQMASTTTTTASSQKKTPPLLRGSTSNTTSSAQRKKDASDSSRSTIIENKNNTENKETKPHPLNFYMLITKGDVTLGKRTPQIALESACYHHRDNAIIHLYLVKDSQDARVSPDLLDAFAQHHCRIIVREFDAQTFFQDTPLADWITERYKYLSTGKYWYSHQTDLFRLAVLYKYGGWYLDSDVVVRQPLTAEHACTNCIGREVKEYFNNAISHFDAGHPFLVAVMKYVMETYNRNTWTSAGPTAATEALKLYKHKDCKDCKICVTTLPRSRFFPIVWTKGQDLVVRQEDVESDQVQNADWSQTWALHYWNKRNAALPLYESSVVNRFYRQSCLLCNVEFVKDKDYHKYNNGTGGEVVTKR